MFIPLHSYTARSISFAGETIIMELAMKETKNTEAVLKGIMKHPHASDRAIAKIIGISQPTVTRMRRKFEEAGIYHYSVIPDLAKIGYEILAISQVPIIDSEANLKKKLLEDDKVIFAGRGIHGVAVMSKHTNFQDYYEFCDAYLATESLPIATSQAILKPITFNKP